MATISEALAIAVQHHQAGRWRAAEQIYRQILAVDPQQPDAIHLLGMMAHGAGQHEVAIEYIQQAIRLNGTESVFHNNLGAAYRAAGKLPEAVACYRQAVELKPGYAEAHYNLGNVFRDQGKLDEAVTCYRRAVELKPDYTEAHNNLGIVFTDQGKLDEAVTCYCRALDLKPDHANTHNNLGSVFRDQGKLAEAVACYRRALDLKPDHAEVHTNLGNALMDQGKLGEADACFHRALELKPDDAKAHYSLGNALRYQGKLDEAVACYRRAVELKPDYLAASSALAHGLQNLCDWEELKGLSQRVIELVDADTDKVIDTEVSPFAFLTLPTMTTAEQQLRCARQWVERQLKLPSELARKASFNRPSGVKSKITIGYLSADFHSHAIAMLTAELFEKHDRGRFAVFAYSCGCDDHSPMRRRLVNAFDRFVDVRDHSYAETAQRIAADEVDILVDLTGYTRDARTKSLALRPAPIQVNYLGYPGTMGASFMDYILVDDFIVRPEQQPFFAEQLVYLPGCYQVNDSQREISPHTPSRAECDLPEAGFVFCCFNNNYKITPEVFGMWMRLLHAVPGSVLWLLEGNRFAPGNLRREAQVRGIAAERLVFAPRLAPAEHLARHRRADLFLDTFPYNAHTTASDALWVGCPLLTIAGETFMSRVAGSLLRTLGLPELVTTHLDEYEAMAVRLARDAKQLDDLRARLRTNRTTSELFDGGQFAKNLEKAYETMWQIYASGEEPSTFRVSPTG